MNDKKIKYLQNLHYWYLSVLTVLETTPNHWGRKCQWWTLYASLTCKMGGTLVFHHDLRKRKNAVVGINTDHHWSWGIPS